MGYEYDEGVKRGLSGKTSQSILDEVCPFRGDAARSERQRGHEAGIAAKAIADAIRENEEDSSDDNSSSSSYCSSGSSTRELKNQWSASDVGVTIIIIGVCGFVIFMVVILLVGILSIASSPKQSQSSTMPNQNHKAVVAPLVNPESRPEEIKWSEVTKPQRASPVLVDRKPAVGTPTISKHALRHDAVLNVHSNYIPMVVWSDGYVEVWADNNSLHYLLNPQSHLRFPNSSTIHAVPRSKDAAALYCEPN